MHNASAKTRFIVPMELCCHCKLIDGYTGNDYKRRREEEAGFVNDGLVMG
jgi:hypothetical protein